MPAYLASYDLRAPGQKYDRLIEAIKAHPTHSWNKPLESCFLVTSNESAEALYTRLKAKVDANDFILVIRIGRPHQGWPHAASHDWINAHVANYG
jgi:hypothetical protein